MGRFEYEPPGGGGGGGAHAADHVPGGADEIDWDGKIHMEGTLAARPAAGASNNGALYYATDAGGAAGQGCIYRSNGSTWVAWVEAAELLPFDPYGEISETNIQGAIQNHEDRLAATAFINALDDGSVFYDDFRCATTEDGEIGETNWSSALTLSGAISYATGAAATANGAVGVGTGVTALAAAILHRGGVHLYGCPELTWQAKHRRTTLNDGTNDATDIIGISSDTAGTAEPASGMYFKYEAGNANYKCVTANASTRTTTTSSVAVATTYKKLRITCDGAGTVRFYIDDMDTPVATHTTNLPSAVQMGHMASIFKTAGSGTARTMQLDYVASWFGMAR